MKKLVLSLAFVSLISVPGWAQNFSKVFLIVLENANYSRAVSQPFLKQLAQNGVLLTNYNAISHPSYPNYLALTSGSTQGMHSDSVRVFNVKNLADLLEAHGKTWKNYAEGHPGRCTLETVGKFAPKHIPFLSYGDIQNDSSRCESHVVDETQLATDIQSGTLPDFSFYTPDLNNDGHDTSVAYASSWLEKAFGGLLGDPKFITNMLFVVTFDEDEGILPPNHIYTALYGPAVKAGTTSAQKVNHYSLLRTIEDVLGLGSLGQNDGSATPIQGIWK